MKQSEGVETRDRPSPAGGLGLGLLAAVLMVLIGVGSRYFLPREAAATKPPGPAPARVETLIREREELDKTVWADEVLAQEYEDTFVKLWDDLRAATDQALVLAEFPFDTLIVGQPQEVGEGEMGIRTTVLGGAGLSLDRAGWKELLGRLTSEGYTLVESEWHHSKFEPRRQEGARSTVAMLLHVQNPRTHRSYIVRGDLIVDWKPRGEGDRSFEPRAIDARNLKVLEREGPPVFQ